MPRRYARRGRKARCRGTLLLRLPAGSESGTGKKQAKDKMNERELLLTDKKVVHVAIKKYRENNWT